MKPPRPSNQGDTMGIDPGSQELTNGQKPAKTTGRIGTFSWSRQYAGPDLPLVDSFRATNDRFWITVRQDRSQTDGRWKTCKVSASIKSVRPRQMPAFISACQEAVAIAEQWNRARAGHRQGAGAAPDCPAAEVTAS